MEVYEEELAHNLLSQRSMVTFALLQQRACGDSDNILSIFFSLDLVNSFLVLKFIVIWLTSLPWNCIVSGKLVTIMDFQ